MQLGTLTFDPIALHPELVAKPIQAGLEQGNFTDGIFVSAIDPELADTASFCEKYDVALDISANCIIVEAKRADRVWYVACIILATDMIDVNGKVRRELDARKTSFAPKEVALALTGMEFGGITPLGLPEDWRILVDTKVLQCEQVIIGSGIRGSKILARTDTLASLDNIKVMDITK
jgi:prolyl-tRNA editing enzyme YbaK/EbsC (Cys-tRNA(Pro) deacylase)